MAERCEVGSHESGGGRPVHSLYVTRQKRNLKAHEKRKKKALLSRCNYLHVPLVNEKPVGIGHRMLEFLKCCF